jgi:hypothetical protein
MSKSTNTTRRSFLKSGAIVAAPIAAVAAPAAVLAGDGSSARLARLEDTRAIEALNRDFVRRFNASGAEGAARLFVRGTSPRLDGAARLALDPAAEPELFEISDDGASARCRQACIVEHDHALEGEGTLIQMARLQGNTQVQTTERRVLVAEYVRRDDGWAIGDLRLA